MKSLIVKRSTIYLVWVIPIIAIIVSGIMLYNEYAKMGETVVIIFKDAQGFKQDETPIKYKGILIGTIKDIEVDSKDLNKFLITAKIKKSFAKYLTEGARFWKVSPKLKPTEFTGLSTLFSGTYIEFSPATNDAKKLAKLKEKRKFQGFEEEPKTNVTYFKLLSDDGSLIEGAPVLFRNFIVGNITKRNLKGKKIEYVISINNKYAGLVKVDSNFWKISPVDIKASFPDLQLKVNNTLNFFFGGIQFDSPDNSPSVCSLNKNSREFSVCNREGFYLFPSQGDTEYSLTPIKLILKNAHKVQSALKLVYYKGDVAGKVIESNYKVESDTRYFLVKMKRKYAGFLSYKSVFWIQKPSVENLSIPSILKGTHIEFAFYNKKVTPKKEYVLYHSRPYGNVERIALQSEEPVGLNAGDFIFYGRTVVGEIISVNMEGDGEIYHCVIYADYKKLLKSNLVFFKKSGFEGSFDSDGLNIRVSPIKELLLGGAGILKCSCSDKLGENKFPVFKNRSDAEKFVYLNGKGVKTTLITSDLKGIYKGMGIFLNGMKIGRVYGIKYNQDKDKFELKAYIEKPFKKLLNKDTVFYKASGVDLTIGVDEIKFKTEGLISLLKGAIVIEPLKNGKGEPLGQYPLLSEKEYSAKHYETAFLLSDNAFGLKPGSKITYKGVTVGKVKSLSVANGKVKSVMLIDKKYAYLLSDKSKIYVEKEKVAAGEVKNISSSFFGAYLKIAYFPSNSRKKEFTVAGVNPSDTVYLDGFRFLLYADQVTSLQIGSPLIFRGVTIGEVEAIKLSDKAEKAVVTVFVKKKFRNLIGEQSEFREIKPLNMKVGFIYAKLSIKPVASLVKGGIELVKTGGKPVKEWHGFEILSEEK